MTPPRPPLVTFQGVALGYGEELVIENLDFTVDEGDFLGIVGPNGAGKSTILKALVGILRPRAGRIVYGRALHRDLRLGYVPQRHTLDSVFPLTVAEIVRMACYREAGLLRRPAREAERVIEGAMKAVDIVGLADRRFRALSGGQRQRALIARALATGANFLVLDEPTDGMDLGSQDAILRLMAELNARDGLTIVFVVWFFSGIVFMYVGMPTLPAEERLLRMEPLDLRGLRVTPVEAAASAVAPVSASPQ